MEAADAAAISKKVNEEKSADEIEPIIMNSRGLDSVPLDITEIPETKEIERVGAAGKFYASVKRIISKPFAGLNYLAERNPKVAQFVVDTVNTGIIVAAVPVTQMVWQSTVEGLMAGAL